MSRSSRGRSSSDGSHSSQAGHEQNRSGCSPETWESLLSELLDEPTSSSQAVTPHTGHRECELSRGSQEDCLAQHTRPHAVGLQQQEVLEGYRGSRQAGHPRTHAAEQECGVSGMSCGSCQAQHPRPRVGQYERELSVGSQGVGQAHNPLTYAGQQRVTGGFHGGWQDQHPCPYAGQRQPREFSGCRQGHQSQHACSHIKQHEHKLSFGSQVGNQAHDLSWGSQVGNQAHDLSWGSQVRNQAHNLSWGSQVGNQAHDLSWGSQVGNQAHNLSWGSQVGRQHPQPYAVQQQQQVSGACSAGWQDQHPRPNAGQRQPRECSGCWQCQQSQHPCSRIEQRHEHELPYGSQVARQAPHQLPDVRRQQHQEASVSGLSHRDWKTQHSHLYAEQQQQEFSGVSRQSWQTQQLRPQVLMPRQTSTYPSHEAQQCQPGAEQSQHGQLECTYPNLHGSNPTAGSTIGPAGGKSRRPNSISPQSNRFSPYVYTPGTFEMLQYQISLTDSSRFGRRGVVSRSSSATPITLPQQEEFNRFDLKQVLAILVKDELNASTEQIYQAVMRWVEADASRQTELPKVLLQVRLSLLPIEFLENVVEKNELIQTYESCMKNVKLAKKYRLLFAPDRWNLQMFATTPLNWGKGKMLNHGTFKSRLSFDPPKRIYVFGGDRGLFNIPPSMRRPPESMDFEYFDCQDRSWNYAGKMPTSREGFGVATFQGNIWIVGGDCDGNGSWDDEYHLVGSVRIYNPALDKWSIGPPMMKKRSHLGLVEFKGCLYAIGGKSQTRPTEEFEKSVEIVIPSQNLFWTFTERMNLARANLGAAVLRSRIYVVGGVRLDDPSQMEYYCSLSRQWTLVTIDISRRDYRGLVVVDELMYLMGGDSPKTCNVYNPALDSLGWKKINTGRGCLLPTAAIVAVDGYIYLIGGMESRRRLNDVSGYNPSTRWWDRKWSCCITGRSGAKAVVITKCVGT